jgi:hypothetical protein
LKAASAFQWRGVKRDAARPGRRPPRRSQRFSNVKVSAEAHRLIRRTAEQHSLSMRTVVDWLFGTLPPVRRQGA